MSSFPYNKSNVGPLLITLIIAFVWVACDQMTKMLFVNISPGESLGSLFGGLIELKLVYNTGAAWGIFQDNPFVLGVFSLLVVAALIVFIVLSRYPISILQTLALALIIGGGIGNALDRFLHGYVIDFIAVTFIEFPVFNIADIGVTCGVVLLLVSILVTTRDKSSNTAETS